MIPLENSLPPKSRYARESSWQKVISYLKSKGPDMARLAGNISEQLSSIEAVDIAAEQMPSGNRNESPAQALFRNLNHLLWQDLKEETEQALSEFQENIDVCQSTVRYQIGKTVWNIIYGGFTDICIADDIKFFFNKCFTLISMVENNKCVGFNLVHFVEEDGEGILILSGCEPVKEYLSVHSAAEVCNDTVKTLVEFARKANIKRVGQINSSTAISNQSAITRYVEKEVFPHCSEMKLRKYLYLGSYLSYSAYRSNEYYLLWQENSAPYWQ